MLLYFVDPHGSLSNIADVKSYSYKRLILGYGPNRCNTVRLLISSEIDVG